MPRFVILHHEMLAGSDRASHWDFMLECGESLKTWALALEPEAVEEQIAEQLAEHRLAYLDYEGPVSGNRGQVSRWDSGNYRLIKSDSRAIDVELDGARLCGDVKLTALEGAQLWRFRFVRRLTRSTSEPLR